MRRRLGALLGSLLFFCLAPATVAGYIPWTLTRWQAEPPLLGLASGRWVGWLLIGAGAIAVVECFGRFAIQGLGTPAPVAPTAVLVVSGLYRHVRNPMYVGVVSAIVGQALVLGSTTLLGYAALVWLLFHVFVVLYEESTLERQFGASYAQYRTHVRRWWPRLRQWKGPS